MLVELSARLLNRFLRVATGGRWAHDLSDANVGCSAVISRHAAAHVTLGDDADQLEVLGILNHRRAAAP